MYQPLEFSIRTMVASSSDQGACESERLGQVRMPGSNHVLTTLGIGNASSSSSSSSSSASSSSSSSGSGGAIPRMANLARLLECSDGDYGHGKSKRCQEKKRKRAADDIAFGHEVSCAPQLEGQVLRSLLLTTATLRAVHTDRAETRRTTARRTVEAGAARKQAATRALWA